jgi:electron transfer flavoprotein alpha subunit/NAD-dependent dihydropyrimidine dehydrogenase PreA subunit
MLKIDSEKCNACRLCEKTCPFGAIAVDDGTAKSNESCTLCGACVNVCPQGALAIERQKEVSQEELAQYKDVYIWAECELKNGQIRPMRVAYQLLGRGRDLADRLGQRLVAVAMGDERLAGLESLCEYGADEVLRCRHKLLGEYSTDGYANVLSMLVAKNKPAVLLYGATANGRDLAPRVAARLQLGLTADCTGLHIDDEGRLVQTRPAFGGNIMASIIAPYRRPQTATVRPNVFSAAKPDQQRAKSVKDVAVTLNRAAIRTKLISETEQSNQNGNLETAKVIVAAGMGCHQEECLQMASKLAESLGGVLAVSRAIVDEGLMPSSCQVGQSGITVAPELYIAVGVSGAIQHVVGMSSSKMVIAINKDPEAPIFKVADLAVVGDAVKILARLISLVKKRVNPERLAPTAKGEA